ncbi:MAG: peptide chain release factor N(5)-glutamine methyltransferase [Firmicutes bacterium]|nr:peptide chain release factor N(5)-glutamine methyltransferase [Bacillota bacterium]
MSVTYRELNVWLRHELADRENLDNEIRWMIEAFSGQDYLSLDFESDVVRLPFYKKAVDRLKHHVPFQYVIGSQDFYGSVFIVNNNVLVPRPETELLVDTAVKWGKGKDLRVLDLCTGSGCIAISLAKNLKGVFAGIDISEPALAVAEKNNQLNGTDVVFDYSDVFHHIPKGITFDLITANPPYLTQKEMREIPLEVTHEPELALDGGPTGIFAIERIMKEVDSRLNKGGLFLMEIGENQGQTCLDLADKYNLQGVKILKDYNDKDRIVYWEK